ncbi:MAG TPA: hypothetical protein PKO33_01650 [Pyrinomonadaceae bacterium]|nr:hypothetical protein [Pyrinomonadaceae bacterium]
MKVFASMPRLESLKGGNKELYVVSIATDLRGAEEDFDRTVSANNQPLDRIVPETADKSLLKYYVMAISNIYEKIKPGHPVSMIGDGIVLYPELDPKGLLGLDIFVVESDAGHRSAGKLFEGLLGDKTVKQGVDSLIAAGAKLTAPLVGDVANAVVSVIPAILKKNHDDLLFSIAYSGRASRKYSIKDGSMLVTRGNELIDCDIAFDLIEE